MSRSVDDELTVGVLKVGMLEAAMLWTLDFRMGVAYPCPHRRCGKRQQGQTQGRGSEQRLAAHEMDLSDCDSGGESFPGWDKDDSRDETWPGEAAGA